MDPSDFTSIACATLKEGGFNFEAANNVSQDAVYIMAWRGEDPLGVVIVSASGLELLQNEGSAIRDLAETRAKNAMSSYDAAV
jgi:hypothetical protein